MKTEEAHIWRDKAWIEGSVPTRNPAALLRKVWPWPLSPESDQILGDWYEYLREEVADDIAADLDGTCDAASGELMEELEADPDVQERVEELVFCCVTCGWWFQWGEDADPEDSEPEDDGGDGPMCWRCREDEN